MFLYLFPMWLLLPHIMIPSHSLVCLLVCLFVHPFNGSFLPSFVYSLFCSLFNQPAKKSTSQSVSQRTDHVNTLNSKIFVISPAVTHVKGPGSWASIPACYICLVFIFSFVSSSTALRKKAGI